jgi:rod shape determining protein RodA
VELHRQRVRTVTVTAKSIAPPRRGLPFDIILAVAPILVALVGVVMVYSATRGPLLADGEDTHTYLKKQALFVFIGVIVMVVVALFDYRKLEPVATPIYILTILALLGVFVIGNTANGAARWFTIGPLELQPSEFAVVSLIIVIAAYCHRRTEEGLAWKDVFKLLILAGVPIILVLKQPDLGTAIIMLIVLLIMLAVAGLPLRIMILLLVGVGVVALVAVEAGFLHGYQIARLTSFLNPNSTSTNSYVQSSIYNLNQSKTAIGSGGLTGSGILRGAQTNLGYVPEQQTDFIFSAVGEQLGFIGGAGLLGVLGVIAWRVLHAAGQSRDVFGRLICTGLFSFLAFSVFQNAGMTMGIMPITGIPLPFVSYGGTAVLCFFVAIGLALSVGARRRRL